MARKKKEEVNQADVKTPAEVVMEKNGKLLISSSEYTSIQKGTVPDRVKEEWGVNLSEAREMLQVGFYEKIK